LGGGLKKKGPGARRRRGERGKGRHSQAAPASWIVQKEKASSIRKKGKKRGPAASPGPRKVGFDHGRETETVGEKKKGRLGFNLEKKMAGRGGGGEGFCDQKKNKWTPGREVI